MNVKDCPEIIEVKPLENLNLLVKFKNGVLKRLDVAPYLKKFSIFNELKDRTIFENVKVDSSGWGIVWNKKLDLSACDIWEFGVETK